MPYSTMKLLAYFIFQNLGATCLASHSWIKWGLESGNYAEEKNINGKFPETNPQNHQSDQCNQLNSPDQTQSNLPNYPSHP